MGFDNLIKNKSIKVGLISLTSLTLLGGTSYALLNKPAYNASENVKNKNVKKISTISSATITSKDKKIKVEYKSGDTARLLDFKDTNFDGAIVKQGFINGGGIQGIHEATDKIFASSAKNLSWVLTDKGTLYIAGDQMDQIALTELIGYKVYDDGKKPVINNEEIKKITTEKAKSPVLIDGSLSGGMFVLGPLNMMMGGFEQMRLTNAKLPELTEVNFENTVLNSNMRHIEIRNMPKLAKIAGIENWDTKNLNTAEYMFCFNPSLESISDLSNWDMNNVTNAHSMFLNAGKLKELNVPKMTSGKLTNMLATFEGTETLQKIGNIDTINTENVDNMVNTFAKSGLLELVIPHWKTTNVTSMVRMFESMSNIRKLDISGFDTTKARNNKDPLDSVNKPIKDQISSLKRDKINGLYGIFHYMRTYDPNYDSDSKMTYAEHSVFIKLGPKTIFSEYNETNTQLEEVRRFQYDNPDDTGILSWVNMGSEASFVDKLDVFNDWDKGMPYYKGKEYYGSSDSFMKNYDGSKPDWYLVDGTINVVYMHRTYVFDDKRSPNNGIWSASEESDIMVKKDAYIPGNQIWKDKTFLDNEFVTSPITHHKLAIVDAGFDNYGKKTTYDEYFNPDVPGATMDEYRGIFIPKENPLSDLMVYVIVHDNLSKFKTTYKYLDDKGKVVKEEVKDEQDVDYKTFKSSKYELPEGYLLDHVEGNMSYAESDHDSTEDYLNYDKKFDVKVDEDNNSLSFDLPEDGSYSNDNSVDVYVKPKPKEAKNLTYTIHYMERDDEIGNSTVSLKTNTKNQDVELKKPEGYKITGVRGGSVDEKIESFTKSKAVVSIGDTDKTSGDIYVDVKANPEVDFNIVVKRPDGRVIGNYIPNNQTIIRLGTSIHLPESGEKLTYDDIYHQYEDKDKHEVVVDNYSFDEYDPEVPELDGANVKITNEGTRLIVPDEYDTNKRITLYMTVKDFHTTIRVKYNLDGVDQEAKDISTADIGATRFKYDVPEGYTFDHVKLFNLIDYNFDFRETVDEANKLIEFDIPKDESDALINELTIYLKSVPKSHKMDYTVHYMDGSKEVDTSQVKLNSGEESQFVSLKTPRGFSIDKVRGGSDDETINAFDNTGVSVSVKATEKTTGDIYVDLKENEKVTVLTHLMDKHSGMEIAPGQILYIPKGGQGGIEMGTHDSTNKMVYQDTFVDKDLTKHDDGMGLTTNSGAIDVSEDYPNSLADVYIWVDSMMYDVNFTYEIKGTGKYMSEKKEFPVENLGKFEFGTRQEVTKDKLNIPNGYKLVEIRGNAETQDNSMFDSNMDTKYENGILSFTLPAYGKYNKTAKITAVLEPIKTPLKNHKDDGDIDKPKNEVDVGNINPLNKGLSLDYVPSFDFGEHDLKIGDASYESKNDDLGLLQVTRRENNSNYTVNASVSDFTNQDGRLLSGIKLSFDKPSIATYLWKSDMPITDRIIKDDSHFKVSSDISEQDKSIVSFDNSDNKITPGVDSFEFKKPKIDLINADGATGDFNGTINWTLSSAD